MDIMNMIDDNTILIMPHNIKTKILKANKQLLNIKSFTKQELSKKILFDYDEQTIYYLMRQYHYKYDVALMYLNNIYYIDDVTYESDKLNNLVNMKKELESHDLLLHDNFFLDSLNNKKVIVYGYDYIDKFFKKMLDIISKYASIEIIEDKNINQNDIKIYEFNDIGDEVNFTAYSICNLIKQGIDINNIKLGNINDDYHNPLKRIFHFYNIPINLNEKMSLYRTDMVLSFIRLFKETHNLQNSLDQLKELYNLNDENNLNIYNKIVTVCNEYLWYDSNTDDITELLINTFKKTYLKEPLLSNAIEVIDLKNNVVPTDNYVFVMGFNQGSMPLIYKNENYITDDLANVLNLETTNELNAIEGQVCLNIIKHLAHLIVTYKLKTKDSIYYPSSLIDELKIDVIKNPQMDIKVSYSKIQDEINLSKKLDKLSKYDELENDTDILYHNYADLSYKTYNNHFTGIDNHNLLNHISPKLKLSYSSIDDYFKCAFKYYINNVMNFKSREEAFHLTIGNLFHYVLSFAFKSDFDFDKTWQEFLKDKQLSSKESFFLLKLRDELKFIIKTIEEQNKLSTFDKALYEEKIYVNKPNKIDVTFSGIVDKIMYKESDKTLISIVDYKTGNTDIDITNAVHGLNMQLPIYLYLVKNSNQFNNPTFVGFYLQEILHNEISNDHSKDYETKKQERLRLKGYTLDQEELIEQFDTSYKDSRVIKSMKIGNNGFYAYSKILNEKQINQLIELVDRKIDEGTNNILDGKFDVNPKRIGGKNIACEYCEFRDMCYMKDSDIINLKEYKNLDFLGGDNHE